MLRLLSAIFLLTLTHATYGQNCYRTSIVSPSPFMGNNAEIFKTSDGRLWEVKYEYRYLYQYYPTVDICDNSKLLVNGQILSITPVGSSRSKGGSSKPTINYPVKVILKPRGCRGYFLADGDANGIYLLEWFGGHDPSMGESILGELNGYSFKEVFYPDSGQQGRVYVDDYMLSRERAIEKMKDKCR